MASLREACVAAGLEDVVTVGNTGNIIFRSTATMAQCRKLVQAAVQGFDLPNEVFIDTPRRMAEVVAANPFPEAAVERPDEMGVCTFHRAPDWGPVMGGYEGPEMRAAIGAHLVVAYPAGLPSSRLRIEKLLGVTMTMRNWRVFASLAEKATALSRKRT